MPYSDYYQDPIEKSYILSNGDSKPPVFAPGELCKIENFESAKENHFFGWSIHHRLEINLDGTTGHSRGALIREKLYYNRPAPELLFLTDSDHTKLHYRARELTRHSNHTQPPTQVHTSVLGQDTRCKMREAKVKANDTERRYKLLTESIAHGDTLCFRDYAFYRRYCQRNGIEFTGCKVDKTSKISTIDFQKPKPPQKITREHQFLNQVHRYREILQVIKQGDSVSRRDAEFMRRFCTRTDWAIPEMKIDWKK